MLCTDNAIRSNPLHKLMWNLLCPITLRNPNKQTNLESYKLQTNDNRDIII